MSEDNGVRVPVWALISVMLMAAYFFAYAAHPANPLVASPGSGWWGWWDQSQYLKSALALARFDLDPDQHWYPLGYAALAAPFAVLGVPDPFLPVNAVSFAAYVAGVIVLFRRHIGSWTAGALSAIALIWPLSIQEPISLITPILSQFAVPWNSTPVAAAYLWILVVLARMVRSDEARRVDDAALGALATLVLVSRPFDVAALAPLGLAYLVFRLQRHERWRLIGAGVSGAALVAAPVVALHLLIYKGLATPYSTMSGDIGLGFGNLVERAYAILIDPSSTWGEGVAVFGLHPWLFVGAPLVFAWLWRSPREAWPVAVLLIGSVLAYLAYNDFAPLNIMRFMLVHYFVWALPVALCAAFAGAAALWKQKRWVTLAFASLAIPVALSSLRIAPQTTPAVVEVEAADPASVQYVLEFPRRTDLDAVDFRGAQAADWTRLTTHGFNFLADDRPLSVFKDYRTIAMNDGVRVIFNKNLRVRHLALVLGDPVINAPTDGAAVSAVQFSWTLRWPWSARAMSTLDAR